MVMSVHNSIDRKRQLVTSNTTVDRPAKRFAFDEMTLNKKQKTGAGSSSTDASGSGASSTNNNNNNNKLVSEFSEKMCATYVKAAFDSLERVCWNVLCAFTPQLLKTTFFLKSIL